MARRLRSAGNLLRAASPFACVHQNRQPDLCSVPDRIDGARIMRGEHKPTTVSGTWKRSTSRARRFWAL